MAAALEFRDITGEDASERTGPWQLSAIPPRSAPGEFSQTISDLSAGRSYEFRAVIKFPTGSAFGQGMKY
jgi:hypothetical protein